MLSDYNRNNRSSSRSLFGNVDMVALGIYIAIAIIGLLCITSASFEPDTTNFFSTSHNYIKQLMWIGISWVMATVVLLLERRFFHMFAYPTYALGILLLLAVLLFGKEVNGAKAWFELGSVRLQPVEFVKIATALMMARVMSDYAFNINRFIDLLKVAAIILIPFLIIVLQNDTGSGLVLGAFLFVLYREGLTKYVYFPVLFTIVLFVAAMMFSPVVIFVVLLFAFVLYSVLRVGEIAGHVRFLAGVFLVALLLAVLTPLSGYAALMIACGISAVGLAIVALKTRTMMLLWPILMFIYAMVFVPTTDFLFSKLEPHQKNRILTFVGLVDDPKNTGYNVNQSQIAIGSGGMWGKGFMEGTQIKYVCCAYGKKLSAFHNAYAVGKCLGFFHIVRS